MTAPQELSTARLLLRPFALGDIPAIARLAGAREISSTTANIPHPYTEQDAREFLARASDEFRSGQSMTFAICVSSAGVVSATPELIGAVRLILAPAHQRAELGYWIGVPFWEKDLPPKPPVPSWLLDLRPSGCTESTHSTLPETSPPGASSQE